jgi:heme a synthase
MSAFIRRFSSIASSETNVATNWVKSGWEKPVGYWLAGSSAFVIGMVGVGGYTRLSGAGLSMTDWNFSGKWLPRTDIAWQDEFSKYKESPEYIRMHKDRMSLDEFKQIYFTEWFHRMLGRATGLFFTVPLAGFAALGVIKKPLGFRLSALAGLGLTQGFVGWWMVRSGLKKELLETGKPPRVSSYRMCFHWLMALSLYAGTLWCSWSLLLPTLAIPHASKILLRRALLPITGFTGLTLASGPFVAGIDAGRAYNTWPKMIDRWIPESYSLKSVASTFEDTGTVQFNHRILAYSTVASAFGYYWVAKNIVSQYGGPLLYATRALPLVAFSQMCLGITTLLFYVPIELGVLHQLGGLATFTSLLLVRFLTK